VRYPHPVLCIRDETAADVTAIEQVTVAAFRGAPYSSQTEHLIVRALRDAEALAISLVASEDDIVVGHVAISPVSISDGAAGWFGLGPVSVAPERQRCGIGSRLVEDALVRLRLRGAAGCVVLGDPGYYGRFGFTRAEALVLADVPPEFFQARAFGASRPKGLVAYHAAFHAQR